MEDNNKNDISTTKQPSEGIKGFLPILLKRWWIVALCMVIFGGLAALYAYIKTPLVSVKATVMISEDSKPSALSLVSKMSLGNLLGGSGSVDNEQYVMGSHTVFERMVKDLGLNIDYVVKDGLKKKFYYPVAPVILQVDPERADTISTGLQFKVFVDEDGKMDIEARNSKKIEVGYLMGATSPAVLKTPYGPFTFVITDKYKKGEKVKETISYSSYSGAAEDYSTRVKINLPSKRADVITMTINHVDPNVGKLVLADIIDIYNEIGSKEKNEKGTQTLKFIDERIQQVQEDLFASERRIEEYKEANNISDVKADVTYAFEAHGELQKNLIELESQLQSLELIKTYLSKGDESMLIPEISLSSEEPIKSIADYNQLVIRRRELARSAKEGNVALEQLDENIGSMRKAILQTVNQAIGATNIAVSELKAKDVAQVAEISRVPKSEKDLRELAREQSIQEQLYIFLLEQREQIAMTSLNSLPRGQVVEKPYVLAKAPGLPKLYLIFGGLVFGFCVGAGFFYTKYLIRMILKKS